LPTLQPGDDELAEHRRVEAVHRPPEPAVRHQARGIFDAWLEVDEPQHLIEVRRHHACSLPAAGAPNPARSGV
jgi:hypothetical protein